MLTQAYAHQCFAYTTGPYKDPNTKHKHGGLKRGSIAIIAIFKGVVNAVKLVRVCVYIMYIQGGHDESGSFIDRGISIPRIKWSLSRSAKTCLNYFFSVNITNICKLRCRSFSWWGSGAKSASLLGRKSLQSSIFHFSTSKSAQIHRLMAPPFQIFRPSPREANLCVRWMSLLFICTSFAMRPIDSPSIPEHWRDLETNSKTFKLVKSKWVNLQQESMEMQGTTGFP